VVGSGCGQFDVLFWHLTGGIKDIYGNLGEDSCCVPVEIRTGHLLHISQSRYHLHQLTLLLLADRSVCSEIIMCEDSKCIVYRLYGWILVIALTFLVAMTSILVMPQ
jgi:hypothetical protein